LLSRACRCKIKRNEGDKEGKCLIKKQCRKERWRVKIKRKRKEREGEESEGSSGNRL
jgi:hypothetical protein